jgi:hypothetical protein
MKLILELFKKFQNRHAEDSFVIENVQKRIYTIMQYFVNQD